MELPHNFPAIALRNRETPMLLVSLSGGGFRASLFHLGVLRAMYELGQLRDGSAFSPIIVNAVSGGAISAVIWDAYLQVCNHEEWSKQNPMWPEQQLLKLIAMSPKFGGGSRFSIRGYIPRWSWRGRLARWWRMVEESLPIERDWTHPVSFLVETVDFRSGELFVIHRNRITRPTCEWFRDGGEIETPHDQLRTPLTVAAATAFPIYFPAVKLRVTNDLFRHREAQTRLIDAGLIDNTGVLPFFTLFGTFWLDNSYQPLVQQGDQWYLSQAGRPMKVPEVTSLGSITRPVGPMRLLDRIFRLTGDIAQPLYEEALTTLMRHHTGVRFWGSLIGVTRTEELPWLTSQRFPTLESFASLKTMVNRLHRRDSIALMAHGAQVALSAWAPGNKNMHDQLRQMFETI